MRANTARSTTKRPTAVRATRPKGSTRLAGYGLRHGTVKPYLMFDHMDVPEADPFFAGIPDREGWVVGVRWDPDPRAALKAEYTSQRVGEGDRTSTVRAQLAVCF